MQAQQESSNNSASKKAVKKNARRDTGVEENPDDFIDPETLLGERKKMSAQMAKQYNPTAVEKS